MSAVQSDDMSQVGFLQSAWRSKTGCEPVTNLPELEVYRFLVEGIFTEPSICGHTDTGHSHLRMALLLVRTY